MGETDMLQTQEGVGVQVQGCLLVNLEELTSQTKHDVSLLQNSLLLRGKSAFCSVKTFN